MHIADKTHRASARQITFADKHHVVSNAQIWSPDSRYLVYDLRKDSGFTGRAIEIVDTQTKATREVYRASENSACGVASWHPRKNEVVFIQGPEPETPDWTYDFSRRSGVIVDTDTGKYRPMEALNYRPPFVAGALRGGSHVHMFDGEGQWISYTYDDEILTRPIADKAEPSRRVIAVSAPVKTIETNKHHPRNRDADYFSFVATQTTPIPRPGSDEINRAFEDAWVGKAGYRKADGKWQKHALAFQGNVVDDKGRQFSEVFIVDLPEDPTEAGDGLLEGDTRTMPAPPKGTQQRRLTYTQDRPTPGLQGPRHWLRSSPDGEHIAFLMKDEKGIVQLFTVSPRGGPMKQITDTPKGVRSNFTWSPDGKWIACVIDGSVCLISPSTQTAVRLTVPDRSPSGPRSSPCAFSPDGKKIAYLREIDGVRQLFVVELMEIPNIP